MGLFSQSISWSVFVHIKHGSGVIVFRIVGEKWKRKEWRRGRLRRKDEKEKGK